MPFLRQRPAAVVGDERVNLRHERARLGQRADGALVMLDVVVRERAAFAVFEPLLAHLIAADAHLPHDGRNALEILVGIDINPASANAFGAALLVFCDEINLLHFVASGNIERNIILRFFLEGMERNQLCTEFAATSEHLVIFSYWHPREIKFDKLDVTVTVTLRIKNGVDVMKNIFRPEGLFQIAASVWNELQADGLGKLLHKFSREIRSASVFVWNLLSLFFSLAI